MGQKNLNNDFSLEKEVGGKAKNLSLLKKKGLNVPSFFIIPHTNFENFKLKDIVKNLTYKIKPLNKTLILRSSATGEDGGENSFAGIFESIKLNNLSNLNSELKKIRTSLYSNKLYSYIKSKKIKEKPKLSVIVQEFIEGDVSGVIFSSVTKNGKMGTLINSNFGGASSVVNGKDSDSFFIDKGGDILEKTKSKKEYSLTKNQITSLLKIARRIESIFESPQDIEFTIKKDKIYILQTRPITKDISEEILVWDNSNIAESYSGIILPLTSSYIRYAYQITYMDLARKSGVSREKIHENQNLFNNLLGFFYGRVYYNMLNWYKMLTLYPGYERNKRNLDIMISTKSREELDSQYKQNVSRLFRLKYYTKLFSRYPFFNKEIRGFKRRVRDYLSDFNKINLNDLNQEDLIKIYHNSINELLNKWSVTVESDFLLMTYFGMLKKFCKKNNLEGSFIQFISDIKNVISANQVSYLSNLAKEFNKFEELINLANKMNYRACLKEINSNLKYKSLKDHIQNYLKEYGGRFANELKLETEDLDTNPEYIIKLLLLYSKSGLTINHNKNPPIKSMKLSLTRKVYLNYLLKKIKFYARQREEMRLLRAQSFSIARKIFFEIGKRFRGRGNLKNAEDIFYLEIDEIISHINKNSKDKDLIKKVNIRKKQYNSYETKELEDVFYTYGYSISSKFTKIADKDSDNAIRGQGCSSGIVKGKVKILDSFSLPDKGVYDIVITKHTDPGWTPLFGLCKGIIVEHGGLLSHASIISRELNLPCIIGLKNATKLFKDGQTITINGFSGEVTVHD